MRIQNESGCNGREIENGKGMNMRGRKECVREEVTIPFPAQFYIRLFLAAILC